MGEPEPRKGPYKFTREELQVLERCNRESFYKRCLPFSTVMGLATYYAIKSGYLKPNMSMGPVPKVAAAVVVGYFLGKVSYQQQCAEMMMRLPNSELAEMLRNRRQGGGATPTELLTLDSGLGSGNFPSFSTSKEEIYSDLDMRPYADLDVERPLNEGLNDSFRPSLDYTALEDETSPKAKQRPPVTYDELRRKNREDYAQQQGNLYRSQPSLQRPATSVLDQSPADPGSQPPPPPTMQGGQDYFPSRLKTYGPSTAGEKNKYGDVWEK